MTVPQPPQDDKLPGAIPLNRFGLPRIRMTAPRSNRGNAHQHQEIDNSRNKTVNESLPWLILLALTATLALGLAIAGVMDDISYTAQLNRMQAEFNARQEDNNRQWQQRVAALQQSNDLLIYYVMELDAKFVGGKFLKPEETWASQQLNRAKQAQPKPEKETKP